ncbi:hypothetical protein CC78DRAFT_410681, partial [Lojkania enalia]
TTLDRSSIRLFRFSQGADGGLVGELHQFELRSAPPFLAASYAWGTKQFTKLIRFQSGSLLILANVADFLGMVASHQDFSPEKDWWFVDSICINMNNDDERETQVNIMDEIYGRSRRTIVWLGNEQEAESDCRGAIPFLHQLSNMKEALDSSKALRRQIRGEEFTEHWKAVGRLFSRPWWTRVWTLQEFIIPEGVKLFCGPRSINRGDFKLAMYCIERCNGMDDKSMPRAAFDAAWNRRRIHQWHKKVGRMNLIAILAYLGNHMATDARDRIYSVRGLITGRDKRLVNHADYQISTERVFAGLVRDFWEEYMSLDIICFAHSFNRYSGNLDSDLGLHHQNLPTWAPDWRAHIQSSPVPLMVSQSASESIGNFRPLKYRSYKAVYNAPGPQLRSLANVEFLRNLKEMMCDGVIIDYIDGLGSIEGCDTRCQSNVCKNGGHTMVQPTRIQEAAVNNKTNLTFLEDLKRICRALVLDRKDKYLRFRAPDQYFSDFLLLCYKCTYGYDTDVDRTFKIWFEENKDLIVKGINGMSDTTVFDDLPPPSAHLSAFVNNTNVESATEEDTFLNRLHDTVNKKSRRLLITDKGHIGMAPCRAKKGDVAVVLFGCSVPLVLRRVGTREAWQVIGEAYMDGFMDGKVGRWIKKG